MSGEHEETWVIVYYDMKVKEFVTVPVLTGRDNIEQAVHNHLHWKGKQQKLKNLFKVDYKGNVTKFKDLELENPNLIKKIGELTKK